VPETLGKGQFALGKELPTKKRSAKASLTSIFCRALAKPLPSAKAAFGKAFAERQGGVQQRKATVTTVSRRDAFLAEHLQWRSAKSKPILFLKISLSSASKRAAGRRRHGCGWGWSS
jgi:hypothetical protein